MNNRFKIPVLITILLIYAVGFIQAQTEQYKFRHLTTKQGLPSNIVNSIIKDSKGFMWFGTDKGLARYDGYNFKIYLLPEDSALSLNNQEISKIFEDNKGNLWIGTMNRGLKKFDRFTETFSGFVHNPDKPNSISHNTVNTIYQDREGVLWIGTNGGLDQYNYKTGQFTSFKQTDQNPDELTNQVLTLFEDKSGDYWIGTGDGLYLFDRKKEIFSRFDFKKEIPEGKYRMIHSIIEDNNGIIWIGTLWGFFKYDKKFDRVKSYLPYDVQIFTDEPSQETYLSNLYVFSIAESNINDNQVLWIATLWGLNKFDVYNEKFEAIYANPDNSEAISTVSLLDLYLDESSLLWIATRDAGVEVLNTNPGPFHQVITRVSDLKFSITPACFYIDNNEYLWTGAMDEGLFQYDKELNFVSRFKKWDFAPNNPNNNRIDCIYEDSGDNLWLGFYEWGLIRFDREQKTFRPIEMQSHNNAPDPIIFDNILEDKYGLLWIGTNAGLYIKNLAEGAFSSAKIISHDVLGKDRILRIFKDSRANIWISTRNNGLYCLKTENRTLMKFIRYTNNEKDKDGFLGNYIHSIYEDQKGILWFGSDLGLNKFNYTERKFEPDRRFNDDFNGHFIQIYGDRSHNLWIFHEIKGLIRYQPYAVEKNDVKVFDTRDGLPFDNFNTHFHFANSFFQSKDDKLFISSGVGTANGFLWFHPDSIKDNQKMPDVFITDFKVGNARVILDSNINFKNHIILKHDQNFFSFEFTALDYKIPEKNQYAYYLDGFEEDWIYSGNRRFANYTDVAPGNYTFRVKGSNNDGYWNEEGASVHITILPPFWKTWWAYLIYAAIVIAIIYSIIHYYLRRQRLLNKLAIEHVEANKLKELDGLKTRFFTNISHEFRTPLTLILGPIQQLLTKINNPSDKQALSIVLQNAHRLKDLVNQLLSLSKLESGKMKLQATEENLIEFVRSYLQSFESLAHHKNITLDFSADPDEIKAFIDREKITQALNNLLSNAFKFTPEGGRIEVKVGGQRSAVSGQERSVNGKLTADRRLPTADLSANIATISITDTGPGISTEALPHIFDRFYQVDDSMSREQEGSGIGLAIVKEMLKLHQGDVEVESKEGMGTTFRIYLPLGNDHLKEEEIITSRQSTVGSRQSDLTPFTPQPPIPPLQMEKGPGGEVKAEPENDTPILLIVEDNTDMRTFIRGYFEDTYQVVEAGNGHEGLNMAIDRIPDIIISDVMMPKMDGYEFCQKIKTDERTCHIPVILLTARASKESRMEGLETGADDFITKPFDGEELQVRVRNLVGQRKKLSDHYRKGFEVIKMEIPEKPFSLDEQFIAKAKKVVENKLSNPDYGVESFSSDMALSRVQLHRKLRALLDQSATEFIRTIRLNYAISLLRNRAGNISEVAYDAGFNNPTYFSISFKKKYGISPSDYLNQLDKPENS